MSVYVAQTEDIESTQHRRTRTWQELSIDYQGELVLNDTCWVYDAAAHRLKGQDLQLYTCRLTGPLSVTH